MYDAGSPYYLIHKDNHMQLHLPLTDSCSVNVPWPVEIDRRRCIVWQILIKTLRCCLLHTKCTIDPFLIFLSQPFCYLYFWSPTTKNFKIFTLQVTRKIVAKKVKTKFKMKSWWQAIYFSVLIILFINLLEIWMDCKEYARISRFNLGFTSSESKWGIHLKVISQLVLLSSVHWQGNQDIE